MTDEEILAQAASTWAELERHLIEKCPLPVTDLDVARAGCITVLVDLLRGHREITPAELYEPEPERLPLIDFPPIDRRPVSWWKNPHGAGEDAPMADARWEAAVKERWDKHLKAAVRGYSGDDDVSYDK
jgi:hypothetical protein